MFGSKVPEFEITHKQAASSMLRPLSTVSLSVLKGQFDIGDVTIDGLNLVIEFRPEIGGSQKPQVWSIWSDVERHEDGDFFEDAQWFNVHHFLVAKVPKVDKKTGSITPNQYQAEIDEYLENLRHYKRLIKDKLGASWNPEKLSMPRFE